MRSPILTGCLLAFLVLFAGCEGKDSDSDSGDSTSSGGQDAGGASGGIKWPTPSCGDTSCAKNSDCCLPNNECGVMAPEAIFVDTCQLLVSRKGSESTDCPESAEYCQGEVCQSFHGCEQERGECGFWVQSYRIVGGAEIREVSANLGCLPPEDFVTP